jgi:hypothetical protein
MLTDQTLGWLPPERCIVLPDPTDVRLMYRTLRRYAGLAEDTLLIYFAGHGRTGPHNELDLSMTDTDPDELRVSALPFDIIRDVFGDSPATNRVLILDCCFSGRAIQDMSGPEGAILGQVDIEGTYTLTSAPANAVALAPVGADYTAFTGELITLLRTGVPNGPELLTFATVYRQLLHTMTLLGMPLPKQRGTGTVDQLALARNAARQSHQALSQWAGASSQAHTDAAASHHRPSGQGIQDGAIKNKKAYYAAAFLPLLIFFASSLCFAVLSPFLFPPFDDTNGNIIASLFFLAISLWALAVVVNASRILFKPFNLRIDHRGIEVNAAGRHTLYRWVEIKRVSLRGTQAMTRNVSNYPAPGVRGVFIYPLPGAPSPQKISWAWGFPVLIKRTGWIRLVPTTGFNVREIETALARFAGPRWIPDE